MSTHRYVDSSIKGVSDEVTTVKERVTGLENENTMLKKVIVEQQQFIEQCKREKLATNIIITGMPAGGVTESDDVVHSTPDEKIQHLLSVMDADGLDSDNYQVKVLTRNDSTAPTHVYKVSFNDVEQKTFVIEKRSNLARLPNDHPFRRVFIKNEEPMLTRRENERLGRKRRELVEAHTGKNVRIYRGKLTIDDIEVDRFDLNNQLYQGN